jgi:cation-transporting P-type ATPase I
MALTHLTRTIVGVPFHLARPAAGLLKDVARTAATSPSALVATARRMRADRGTALDIPHRRRRVWTAGDRIHVELREIDTSRTHTFVDKLTAEIQAIAGVRWCEILARPGRLVVAVDRDAVGVEAILAALERIEAATEVTGAPLGRTRPSHPSDIQPAARHVVGIAADGVGLGLSLTGRATRLPALPFEIDAAALLTIASYVPHLRSRIDAVSSSGLTEVGLVAARALVGGLAQSVGGPTFDVIHRSALLTAAHARRHAWTRREAELFSGPTGAPVSSLEPHLRATPLPDGPIERMERPTWLASMGGAATSLLVTRSIDRMLALLVAGSPKAEAWGRQAMTAQLTKLLSQRNVLVMDPGALDALDRVDVVVIDAGLLVRADGKRPEPAPFAAELVAAARDAILQVWLSSDDPAAAAPFEASGVVSTGDDLARQIRRMQDEGHGVVYLAAGPSPALAVADVGFALARPGAPPPWDAALIGTADVIDAYLVLDSVRIAKISARQTAHVALAGAGFGGLMAMGGLIPGGTRRVMSTNDLAALVAHLNAVRHGVTLGRQPLPIPPDVTPYHAMDHHDVLARFGTGTGGLDEAEAARRRVVPPQEPPGVVAFAKAVGDEAVNPLTPILAAGAGLSVAAGSPSDALLVGGVLGFNALAGGVQRFRADRALARLFTRERHRVTVTRGGTRRLIETEELVPGDIVHLEAGEAVPADCRIITSSGLDVDESSLTGESLPVHKSPDPCEPPRDRGRADVDALRRHAGRRRRGHRRGAVATGSDTEARRARSQDGPPARRRGVTPAGPSPTGHGAHGRILAGSAIVGRRTAPRPPIAQSLHAGVSLAVAAVPEGLPHPRHHGPAQRSTAALDRGALVRNPRAIEALGRVDLLCCRQDRHAHRGPHRVRRVSDDVGSPWTSTGGRRDVLAAALRAIALRSSRRGPTAPPDGPGGGGGAARHGVDATAGIEGWRRRASCRSSPGSRLPRGARRRNDGSFLLSVKGAPEVVVPRCSEWRHAGGVVGARRCGASRAGHQRRPNLARRGLRILAVAEREASSRRDVDDDRVDRALPHRLHLAVGPGPPTPPDRGRPS